MAKKIDIVHRLRAITEMNWDADEVTVPVCAEAANEIEVLRRWKAEAMAVLNDWDAVFGMVPQPASALGGSKPMLVAAEIERLWENEDVLHAEIAALLQQLHHLSDAGNSRGKDPVMDEIIEDGFGSRWRKCLRHDCSLHVVRPGKVQCEGDYDGIGCPFDQAELASALKRAIELLGDARRD